MPLSRKQKELVEAIKKNDVAKVIELIKPSDFFKWRQVDPNCKLAEGSDDDDHYYTPLALAADSGSVEITQALIEHGANVNMLSQTLIFIKYSPLAIAASKGHEAVCQILLKAGADVNQPEEGKNKHVNRLTPLMYAASAGHVNVAEILIKGGADINRQANDGCTTLWFAAANGHEKMVRALLAYPTINLNLSYPAEIAQKKGHQVIADLILDQLDEQSASPLWKAVQQGDMRTIEQLINNGDNVNQVSRHRGQSPLFLAAEQGHEQAVNALLKARADVNLVTKTMSSPLMAALLNGHEKIAETLIRVGAKVNQRNADEHGPLYFAAYKGLDKIIPLLIKLGADIHQVSYKDGWSTPLYAAASNGHEVAVNVLLERGANIDKGAEYYKTPLYAAAEKGHDKIVKLLLEQGADANHGSPLFIAIKQGHEKIVRLLLTVPGLKFSFEQDSCERYEHYSKRREQHAIHNRNETALILLRFNRYLKQSRLNYLRGEQCQKENMIRNLN